MWTIDKFTDKDLVFDKCLKIHDFVNQFISTYLIFSTHIFCIANNYVKYITLVVMPKFLV